MLLGSITLSLHRFKYFIEGIALATMHIHYSLNLVRPTDVIIFLVNILML
jgi:hypothetical protein